MIDSGDFSFSFSGLKTSVRYLLPKIEALSVPDVCASFQEAVVFVSRGQGARRGARDPSPNRRGERWRELQYSAARMLFRRLPAARPRTARCRAVATTRIMRR